MAAPETANNIVASTALIPLLSFGIPGSNSAAVLLGGLLIHGLVPGPRLFEEDPEIVTGSTSARSSPTSRRSSSASSILPVCIWLVNRPKPYLAAFICALIMSGVYTVHHVALRSRHRHAARASRLFHALFRLPGAARRARRRAGRPGRIQLPALARVVRRRATRFSWKIRSRLRSSFSLSLIVSGFSRSTNGASRPRRGRNAPRDDCCRSCPICLAISTPSICRRRRARPSHLLMLDVAGLCVAARDHDYVKAARASIASDGKATAIGHKGGVRSLRRGARQRHRRAWRGLRRHVRRRPGACRRGDRSRRARGGGAPRARWAPTCRRALPRASR